MNIDMTLKESIFGCEKEIKFQRKILCDKCMGVGSLSSDKNCSSCLGSGIKRIRKAVGNMVIEQTIVCDFCKGSGKEQVRCLACESKGFTTENVKVKIKFPQGIHDGDEAIQKSMGNQYKKNVKGSLIVTVNVKDDNEFYRISNEICKNISVDLIDVLKEKTIDVKLLDDSTEKVNLKNVKHKEKIKLKRTVLNSGIDINHCVFVSVEYPSEEITKRMLRNLDE
jgi:molecular chaperone DnaJ